MMRIRAILTAAAGLALFAIAQPAHAINIVNFNQNPSTPPANGFAIVAGSPNNFTGTSIPVDYTFLVPPNSTTVFAAPGSTGTAKALLTINSGGLTGAATVDGAGNIQQGVSFNVSIVSSNSPFAANTSLLTGTLTGAINVFGLNLTQATINFSGTMWTSAVTYDVGGGPQLLQNLGGYGGSWTLNSATSPITVSGGRIAPNTFGNITGGFAATPEPASMVMLGLGLAAIPAVSLVRRRFAKA